MKIRRKHPVRVNHLGSDPIPQLVRRLALPAMLAQFVNVLYSIIDRMYIGNIANVGDIALAGVGICGTDRDDDLRVCRLDRERWSAVTLHQIRRTE